MGPLANRPETIDITLDGQVRQPPPAPALGGLLRVAILVAVLAGAIAVAALALWFALLLIPVALAAAAVAWLAWRWQVFRRRA